MKMNTEKRCAVQLLMAVLLSAILASCTSEASRGGDIVVIGDSVLAWNRGADSDVGSVIASELGRSVTNHAAFGAQISASDFANIFGLSIPDQLPPGRWNWVVANGAANDLGFSCGCTRCDQEIDELISNDGSSGAIPNLIEKAQIQGANVVWLGYYKAPETKSFEGCRPGLVEIERRIEVLARANNGLFFLDAEDIFDPPSRELFDQDRTHPSNKGSLLIGREIAGVIANES